MKENNKINKNIKSENSGGNASKIDTIKIDFSIVGIGASAGGLDALSIFLGNVPRDSGLAFVIVQHMEKNSNDYFGGFTSECYYYESCTGI